MNTRRVGATLTTLVAGGGGGGGGGGASSMVAANCFKLMVSVKYREARMGPDRIATCSKIETAASMARLLPGMRFCSINALLNRLLTRTGMFGSGAVRVGMRVGIGRISTAGLTPV